MKKSDKTPIEKKIERQYIISLIALIISIILVGYIVKTGSFPGIGSLYEKDLQQYQIEHSFTE